LRRALLSRAGATLPDQGVEDPRPK